VAVRGAMIVRSSDGATVVLNDAVFNMDRSEIRSASSSRPSSIRTGPRVLGSPARLRQRRARCARTERLALTPAHPADRFPREGRQRQAAAAALKTWLVISDSDSASERWIGRCVGRHRV
jgi:hypothetical protein